MKWRGVEENSNGERMEAGEAARLGGSGGMLPQAIYSPVGNQSFPTGL